MTAVIAQPFLPAVARAILLDRDLDIEGSRIMASSTTERRVSGALAHKVSELTSSAGLTLEDIGRIVDASPRSVTRWQSGEVVPQRLNKQRLVELAYVAEAVAEILPPEDVNVWMFTPSRALDHDTPAERIRNGDFKSVLALIDAMADGVVM